MSKTTQDYRNIVKILKLQLLKVREENASLSHKVGIISESETSSFTPKLNHYKQSDQVFAQKVVLFLEFAHRCQLVGISPEMIFRIADKKRDKSVNSSSFGEIMKRVKLRMSDEEINKFVSVLGRKGLSIEYDDYLECLSAFQINSQKYPVQSSRTYVQLCLLQFAQICKEKYSQPGQLFSEIAQSRTSSFKYDNFLNFCMRQCKTLRDVQIAAIFLGLDIQSLCQIQQDIFKREMTKLYSLIDRGLVDEKSLLKQKARRSPIKRQVQKEDSQFQEQTQIGDQKIVKQKKKPVQPIMQQKKSVKQSIKLKQTTTSKVVINQLKKKGVYYGKFVSKLIESQKNKKDIYYRSFSFDQIRTALKATQEGKLNNTEIMNIFKQLDTGRNGSVSTEQLIKIFLRTQTQDLLDYQAYLYALFYRHLKQIQFPDPLTKFTSLDYKATDLLTQKSLSAVFQQLSLQNQQVNFFFNLIGDIKIQNFCQNLKKPPNLSTKTFVPMDKKDIQILSDIVKRIHPESRGQAKFKKLIRNPNHKGANENQHWQTIFLNEWDCFKYCLQKCSQLKNFWRDHQFGPTKGDQHGLRSIIGNESQIPPCLPQEEDIIWLNYEQILKRKNVKKEAILMNSQLKATDVIQGKLGDCWYVSALSIITLDEQYIKGKPIKKCKQLAQLTCGILPPLFHIFWKYGIYVFKFFKKFKPIYVLIDDLLPVQKSSNDLIFAKSPDQHLQWVSFAQKAYAKLHHTYSNMISGDIAQGLNDLTNSLPIKEILKQGDIKNIDNLKSLNDKRQLMGCSIKIPKQQKSGSSCTQPPYEYNDRRCGLLAGHAYSITDCIDVRIEGKTINLIRVRNPWGNSEWLLQWSDTPLDNDPDCQQLAKYQEKIDDYYVGRRNKGSLKPGPYVAGEDGQFLMDIQDWNQIFTNLFIGLNDSYDIAKRQFYQTFDTWGIQKESGVCKPKGDQKDPSKKEFVKNNHQYIMEIPQNGTQVLMLLSQEDGRLYRGQKYPYKEIVQNSIILVFDLDGKNSLEVFDIEKMVDKDRPLTMEARRDVSYWRTYDKGKYAIFPCRSKKNTNINQFQFRVYSNKNINLSKIGQMGTGFNKIQNKPLAYKGDRKSYEQLVEYLQKNIEK